MARKPESTETDAAGRMVHWDESCANTSRPDVFNITTDRSEVEVLYGTRRSWDARRNELTVSAEGRIIMSPGSARGLASALNEFLRQYESRYGVIREPAAAVRGGGRPLRPSLPVTMREAAKAELMLHLVEQLKVPYNFERSFKMVEGALLPNRFLITVDKGPLGAGTEKCIAHICERLNMPENLLQALLTRLPEAQYLHFGFEEGPRATLYKAYLEFFSGWKAEIGNSPGRQDPYLLYLGFKWDSSDTSKSALSKYHCHTLISPDGIRERLSLIYAGRDHHEPLNIALGVVGSIFRRVGRDKVLYLEVTEEGNPRRSYDINMYRCGLRLEELDPFLPEMCEHYRIPREEFDTFYGPIRTRTCGHLSGGVDREGKDFLTIYYGVEDH